MWSFEGGAVVRAAYVYICSCTSGYRRCQIGKKKPPGCTNEGFGVLVWEPVWWNGIDVRPYDRQSPQAIHMTTKEQAWERLRDKRSWNTGREEVGI